MKPCDRAALKTYAYYGVHCYIARVLIIKNHFGIFTTGGRDKSKHNSLSTIEYLYYIVHVQLAGERSLNTILLKEAFVWCIFPDARKTNHVLANVYVL